MSHTWFVLTSYFKEAAPGAYAKTRKHRSHLCHWQEARKNNGAYECLAAGPSCLFGLKPYAN